MSNPIRVYADFTRFLRNAQIVFVLSPEVMYTKCADSDQIAWMLYQFNNYHIYYNSFLSFGTRYFKYLIQKKKKKNANANLLSFAYFSKHRVANKRKEKEKKYSIHSQI